MSEIYTKHEVHGGSKIIIEISHYDNGGENDKSWDVAEIFVIKEKTKDFEEKKVNVLKVYGNYSENIKVEVLCKE